VCTSHTATGCGCANEEENMVRKEDLGIGFHYIDDELTVNLNKIFFKDVYERSDAEVAVDGYIILEHNIEESLKQETLEKIYHMYKKYGIKFVERIKSGKFNLLIHDKKAKKIYVVSDYFGRIPLYYTTNKPFTFSSKILNLNFGEIDWYAMSQFLKYGHFLSNETQDKWIKVLPPHSILEYDQERKRLKLYEYTPKNIEISEDVTKLFKRACDRLYTEEVDYYLGLSGGVDSRFVLYNWKNKEDLIVYTYYGSDIPDKEEMENVEIAKELISKVNVKKHLLIKKSYLNPEEIEHVIDKNKMNPFDRGFLNDWYEKRKKFKITLTGDMAPILSGEFTLLRLKRYSLTVLFGLQLPTVSKISLDKAITRIPEQAFGKYLSPKIYNKLFEIPIPWERIYIEDYHTFSRLRRRQGFWQPREIEILYPFLDYDLYFSCRRLKNRVNNKLYYSLLQKMPPEYKIKTTRYKYPLTYPRRLQFLSMVISDVKREFKPGTSRPEEIGNVLKQRPDIIEYMKKTIVEMETSNNIEELSNKISGGKHGRFFFYLFVFSYWLKKLEKIADNTH